MVMRCLVKEELLFGKRRIQNKLHRIGTYDVYKIILSRFNDKGYSLDDSINSLVYFHKDTLSQWYIQ